MSSKLRLNSPEAKIAFDNILQISSPDPGSLNDTIMLSRRIVKEWSDADLDLTDDIIIPFRAIESQMDGVDLNAVDLDAAYEESKIIFKQSVEDIRRFLLRFR